MANTPTDARPKSEALLRGLALVEEVSAGSRPAKHLMILLGLAFMAVMGAPPLLLLVSPAYLIWDYAYVFHVRARMKRVAEVSWPGAIVVLIHHGANVAAFATFALLVAGLDWMAAPPVAFLFLVAQAFHNLVFDSRSRAGFIVSAVILTLYAQATLFVGVSHALALPYSASLHVAMLMLSAFGTIAGLQANALQRRLEDLTARLAAAQKGETVGRLTSGIAHDFRNLLTVMGGNLDLIREVPPEEHPRLMDEIRAATERGERLTDRLLSTARGSRSAKETIDLDRFLSRFIAFAERVIPANVALRLGTVDRNLTIRADAAELEAALLNLVLNARDAMTGVGSIVIDVTRETDGDLRDEVVLTVRDNGRGMPAELVERVSEPFVTTKPADRGTGLGLAMVEAFAEDTGGSLRIESAPGDGTTIRLNLPI